MTPQEIALEIFGYLGTALVLLSFVMRNIKWLRIVNMIGSLICLAYALFTNTMPQAVLNGSLILINGFQLYNIIKTEKSASQPDNNTEKEETL